MSLKSYRDNNNFLKINLIEKSYERFMIWKPYEVDSFVEIEVNAPYMLGETNYTYYVSRDSGKTFKNETI
jgi:hypothetical protein